MIPLCPCCSGSPYEKCCEIYHLGKEPPTALLLMRSRYSAYAMKLADYIIRTTHPKSSRYHPDLERFKEDILKFCNETEFRKLEVFNFEEKGERAIVVFTAYLTQNGNDATFTERSNFVKYQGNWRYLDGKISQGALV